MKFTITREQLQEGLSGVAAAIPAKTTLPVLANVLVEATKQGLRLSGTDLDIAVTTTVSAEVDAEGAVTLPAKKLVDIARELPSGPVRVTAAGESRVAIECGRSKFKLLGLPREEFPSFPAVKFDGAWNAAAGVVHKLVGHVAFAASTEESRPILNGVLWELRPDHMRMVATNGHRLAKMDVPAKGGSTADLIVPPKALEQIRRLFAADDALEIARSDNHIGFRAGGTLVFSRLIEGPYPNYEQVIPRENDKVATADKAAMAAALRRMSVVASDQTHRIGSPSPAAPSSSRSRHPTWAKPRTSSRSRTKASRSRSGSMRCTCSRSSSTCLPTRYGSPSRPPSARPRWSLWDGTIRRAIWRW